MQDFVLSIVTNKWFILNQIVGMAFVEWALFRLKPLKATTKEQRERDEKYKEFVRDDLEKLFNPLIRVRLYLMVPFMIPKWILCIMGWAYMFIVITLVGLYHTPGNPYGPVTYHIVKNSFRFSCRLTCWLIGGCWWIDYQ